MNQNRDGISKKLNLCTKIHKLLIIYIKKKYKATENRTNNTL